MYNRIKNIYTNCILVPNNPACIECNQCNLPACHVHPGTAQPRVITKLELHCKFYLSDKPR